MISDQAILDWFLSLSLPMKTIVLGIIVLIYPVHKFINDEKFRTDLIILLRGKYIDYTTHPLLFSLSRYTLMINEINFGETHSAKTKIFRIILLNKISIVLSEMKNLSRNKKLQNLSVAELESLMVDSIHKSISDYESKIEQDLNEKYGDKYIYNVVYELRFKEYHMVNVNVLLRLIHSLKESKLTNDSLIYLYFNFIQTALDSAILDCENVFEKLNGHLDKYN